MCLTPVQLPLTRTCIRNLSSHAGVRIHPGNRDLAGRAGSRSPGPVWLSPRPCVGDCPLELTPRGVWKGHEPAERQLFLAGRQVKGPDLERAMRPSATP